MPGRKRDPVSGRQFSMGLQFLPVRAVYDMRCQVAGDGGGEVEAACEGRAGTGLRLAFVLRDLFLRAPCGRIQLLDVTCEL